MPRSIAVVSLVCACFGLIYGQEKKASSSNTAETVKQLERDWSDAMKTGDAEKLNQILADDWVGLEYDGSKETKQSYMSGVKSGSLKLQSFEFGPMEVKVVGNVAVVQGSDTEKSSYKGKDTSGKWAWMDVFVEQGGKWQAVRSQSAKVK